jgi:hypothetical protein
MIEANFPMTTRIFATGDSLLGRGVHGALPLHLVFESNNLRVVGPGKPLRCKLIITVHSNSIVGSNQTKH